MPDLGSRVVVAIDQGTSSTKAIAVNERGEIVASATVPLAQQHPRAGWVEQDAAEIAESVMTVIESVAADCGPVVALGLSTQRESAVLWDRETGEPLGPVLGWQDRRTHPAAVALQDAGHDERVRALSGLPIDPMFSALKFAWLLDEVDPDRSRSLAGELAVGTVDSWLLFQLTGEHRIEAGNASRTQLLELAGVDWDESLLELFRVPRQVLPRVVPSTEASAPVRHPSLGPEVRVLGVLGDSHAALFAHGVREPGRVKVTYGTGSSIMGLEPEGGRVATGLVRTIAWSDPQPALAFEGNILSTGATLVWLAELLGSTPGELMRLASSAPADHTVDLVPAFSGLGAPWWDEDATALVAGFDLGSGRAALARAAAESIVLQIEDVLSAADAGSGGRIHTVLADGGPASNDWLMQLQADLSQRTVVRPEISGLSALGAAYLAGTAVGFWTAERLLALPRASTTFSPAITATDAERRRARWNAAVARSRFSLSHPSTPFPSTTKEAAR
jgi:glycerol kinase